MGGVASVGIKQQIKARAPFLVPFVRSGQSGMQAISEIAQWRNRHYAAPSPAFIKRAVIARNGSRSGTFVETGTYIGDTAAFAARRFARVITIEPDLRLYRDAALRFRSKPNVEVINGTSEDSFASAVDAAGPDITLWLDAHFSGDGTFAGQSISTILSELQTLSEALPNLSRCVIMIDDIRGFGLSPGYPDKATLVRWAEEHHMDWHIEHDIMVLASSV